MFYDGEIVMFVWELLQKKLFTWESKVFLILVV